MSKIITLTGEISPDELGFTSMHEHINADAKGLALVLLKSVFSTMKGSTAYQKGADIGAERARRQKLQISLPAMSMNGVLSSMKVKKGNPAGKLGFQEYYGNEFQAFRACGGQSICDCSPLPFRGASMKENRQLSLTTGVQVISAAGFYIKAAISGRDAASGEAGMQAKIEHTLEYGDGTCDAKPGFVKAALGTIADDAIVPVELAAVKAAARAAKNAHTSLHIHNAFPVRKSMILGVADLLEKEIGIAPDKVIFCHMDSYNLGSGNPAAVVNEHGWDLSLPTELCRRGFNVGLDTWGIGGGPSALYDFNLNSRREMLLALIDLGFGGQITLGHDMMSKGSGVQNGGSGYVLWPKTLTEMTARGEISKEMFHTLTVETPARILAID